MQAKHRRPLVVALAIVLGLCLVVCVIAFLASGPPSAVSSTGAGPAVIGPTPTNAPSSRSIGNAAPCYFEQEHDPALPLTKARDLAAPLLPTDARLIRTYNPPAVPELTVDLYVSEWLADQYTGDVWPGGDPGQFIVIFGPDPGAVSRTVIACGNAP